MTYHQVSDINIWCKYIYIYKHTYIHTNYHQPSVNLLHSYWTWPHLVRWFTWWWFFPGKLLELPKSTQLMSKSPLTPQNSRNFPLKSHQFPLKLHSYPDKIPLKSPSNPFKSPKITFFPWKSHSSHPIFFSKIPMPCPAFPARDGHLRSPGGDLRGRGEEARGAGAAERGKLLAGRHSNIHSPKKLGDFTMENGDFTMGNGD